MKVLVSINDKMKHTSFQRITNSIVKYKDGINLIYIDSQKKMYGNYASHKKALNSKTQVIHNQLIHCTLRNLGGSHSRLTLTDFGVLCTTTKGYNVQL